MASAFHLVALPLGSEEAVLAAAEVAILEVEPGETIFFSEALAWTASGSGVAYMRMVKQARIRDVNIVATLNMGGELTEDLPGHLEGGRYHAVVVFTRHGHVHVPQAKVFPHAAERRVGTEEDAGPMFAYGRSNLVRLDMDEQLIEVRFLIGADIAFLADHAPRAFACDVLIVQSRVPPGAEEKLRASLSDARTAGVASTTLEINGHGTDGRGQIMSVKVEEAADSGKAIPAKVRWPSTTKLPRRLYRYAPKRRDADPTKELERLARDPKRDGRIPILRPVRSPKVELGIYPVTIVL